MGFIARIYVQEKIPNAQIMKIDLKKAATTIFFEY
jgi:hypothetical protein